MEILTNHDIPVGIWNDFLKGNQFTSPFQTPGFYNLFNSVKGLSAEAVAIMVNDHILALAVVALQREPGIKSFFSRRGIIYGGPLINSDYPDALAILLQQISLKLKRKVIYIETRNFSDYSNLKDTFLKSNYQYLPYVNFNVDARDLKSMSDAVSRSRLRQIKKAKKVFVTWEEAKNKDEVMLFYEILARLYKNKIRKPLPPADFFRNFFDSEMGKYLLVWYENKIIGGIMCPVLEGETIYEFYVCGLDDEYKEQYPSIMATWAAMEYANQNNIPLFDFMGAGKHNDQYGVRDFKARFGGQLVEYGRFIKINRPLLYKIGKWGLKAIKKFR